MSLTCRACLANSSLFSFSSARAKAACASPYIQIKPEIAFKSSNWSGTKPISLLIFWVIVFTALTAAVWWEGSPFVKASADEIIEMKLSNISNSFAVSATSASFSSIAGISHHSKWRAQGN